MSINQVVTFQTSPARLYKTLMSSEEFADATGAPADIEQVEGGEFSCFGGQITGRQIELSPGNRIVQAWRAGPWEDGVYSIVRFDISESGDSSTLHLAHTGYPDEGQEHLEGGWHNKYWEPLKAYFDSRKTSD